MWNNYYYYSTQTDLFAYFKSFCLILDLHKMLSMWTLLLVLTIIMTIWIPFDYNLYWLDIIGLTKAYNYTITRYEQEIATFRVNSGENNQLSTLSLISNENRNQ